MFDRFLFYVHKSENIFEVIIHEILVKAFSLHQNIYVFPSNMHQFLSVFQEYLVTATTTVLLITSQNAPHLWFFILVVLKVAK